MKLKKTDTKGTIHDLPNQLANLAAIDKINPKTAVQKAKYRKIFNKYKLFHKNVKETTKKEIINNLKVVNFDETKIRKNIEMISAIEKYNRIINKKRIEIENEVRRGKNVKNNMLLLENKSKVELSIPRGIRVALDISEKAVKLRPRSVLFIRNRLDYVSGQDYKFVIKTGFGNPYLVPYSELQKKRKSGNVVEYLINLFKQDVLETYEKDRNQFAKKDPKEWKKKKKIYDKILEEVLEHNLSIATNKQYNKPFIKRNKDGSISEKDSEIPLFMEIFSEILNLYIP